MKHLYKQFQSCGSIEKIVLISWLLFATSAFTFGMFMIFKDGISSVQ